jgi:hypothetical protein
VVDNSDFSELFSSIVTPAASSHRNSLEKGELQRRGKYNNLFQRSRARELKNERMARSRRTRQEQRAEEDAIQIAEHKDVLSPARSAWLNRPCRADFPLVRVLGPTRLVATGLSMRAAAALLSIVLATWYICSEHELLKSRYASHYLHCFVQGYFPQWRGDAGL